MDDHRDMELLATVRQCLDNLPGSVLEYPFGPNPAVYKVGGKMFALVLPDRDPAWLSVKLPPAHGRLLRDTYPGLVVPGYHLNKTHWNTIVLGGTPPVDEVLELVDFSYDLVVSALPKHLRPPLGRETNRGAEVGPGGRGRD